MKRALTNHPLPELPFRERLSVTGFALPAALTFEDWREIGCALGRLDQSLQWWVGDWWAFGESRYGERKAIVEAEDWTGPSFQTCMNCAAVAHRFETSRRREVLSFKHHAEVAALPAELADRLLDWAAAPVAETGKPQPIRALREEARKAKAQAAQGWTADQLDRKARAEAGECVVASMRENGNGQRIDEALLSWAEAEDCLIRIDRHSEFGNPFVMPDDGGRSEVIGKFEKFYWPNKPGLLAKITGWRGVVLVCWCHPEACHGDVIAATINAVGRGEGSPQEIADHLAEADG